MKLITKEIERQLLKNGATPGEDYKPVLKIFCPWGAATWLITEMDPEDPDILFGLCDRWFTAEHPLSVYADAARAAGSIMA